MKREIEKAPASIGVYIFYRAEVPIYVGKSVNIRARLKSHLENAKHDRKEMLMVSSADSIGYQVTDSEFRALLLESSLIKKYLPKYNVRWRDDKTELYIRITKHEIYPKVSFARKPEIERKRDLYFGPFSSKRSAEYILRSIRAIVPFCMQKRLGSQACFYSKIGLCDPCPSAISRERDAVKRAELSKRYRKNIRMLVSLLSNKQDDLLTRLRRELGALTKREHYEEAIAARDTITHIENLLFQRSFERFAEDLAHDPSREKKLLECIRRYFPYVSTVQRIECYDISNLQLKEAAGSMVVYQGGSMDRSAYRRFRIKRTRAVSDFEMLREIIERRLGNDWPRPDLILIDGGRPQLRPLLPLLTGFAVIGIAKHPDRLVIGIRDMPMVRLSHDDPVLNLFRMIRDESHRFAKKYHLLLRNRSLLL